MGMKDLGRQIGYFMSCDRQAAVPAESRHDLLACLDGALIDFRLKGERNSAGRRAQQARALTMPDLARKGELPQSIKISGFEGGVYEFTRHDEGAGGSRGVNHGQPAILQSSNPLRRDFDAKDSDEGIAKYLVGHQVSARAIHSVRLHMFRDFRVLADRRSSCGIAGHGIDLAHSRPPAYRSPDTFAVTNRMAYASRALIGRDAAH